MDGFLIIDKPPGMTSAQAVAAVKRITRAAKVGHTGTLDPFATGVLVCCLGAATKLSTFFLHGDKGYEGVMRLGLETDTLDPTGWVTRESEVPPLTKGEIEAVFARYTGLIMQTPPAFSAIKVDGERAYDLARAGETVVLEPRPVFIEALTLLGHTGETSELKMTCEKGTYVRALARDLARALGTRGHVIALHRAQVGPFSDVIAVSIEDIERNPDGAVVPVAVGLTGLPEVRLTAQQAQVLRHGNPVLLSGASAPVRLDSAWASEAGSPVALGYVEAGHFHPQRVLLAGS